MQTLQASGNKARIQSHRDLIVWQQARKLNAMSYVLACQLPEDERYGMRAQIQRAAVSIPTHIAEGHGRLGKGDSTRHLSIARGSLAELECLLDPASDVGYLDGEAIKEPMAIAEECNKMLWVPVKKLGSRQLLPRARS